MIDKLSKNKERTKQVYTEMDHIKNIRAGRDGENIVRKYKKFIKKVSDYANEGYEQYKTPLYFTAPE